MLIFYSFKKSGSTFFRLHQRLLKVRKVAEIRKRYNQAPHLLTKDTTSESNKTTINITNKN